MGAPPPRPLGVATVHIPADQAVYQHSNVCTTVRPPLGGTVRCRCGQTELRWRYGPTPTTRAPMTAADGGGRWADGYLPLSLDLPAEGHRWIFDVVHEGHRHGVAFTDRLVEVVPALIRVVAHPVLLETLTTVLGPRFVRLTHNAVHANGAPDYGPWHRDNVWGHALPRCYTDDWAMLLYFPQDTPPELGPTAVMPGTQNDDAPMLDDTREVLAGGPAGSAMLINFHLWHRATPNRLGAPRYMLKFLFAGCARR